jgi:hypothetical protein
MHPKLCSSWASEGRVRQVQEVYLDKIRTCKSRQMPDLWGNPPSYFVETYTFGNDSCPHSFDRLSFEAYHSNWPKTTNGLDYTLWNNSLYRTWTSFQEILPDHENSFIWTPGRPKKSLVMTMWCPKKSLVVLFVTVSNQKTVMKSREDLSVDEHERCLIVARVRRGDVLSVQIRLTEEKRSVTSILKELAAIQQQGPQKQWQLGTSVLSA